MKVYPAKYYAIILLLTIAVLIMCGLQSCSTEKNFVKYHNNHDSTSAKYCSSWYPIQEKIITKRIYKPGETKIIKGEDHVIYANCDSAYQAAYEEMARSGKKNQKIVVKNIPIYIPTRVDTIFLDSTIVKESTAKLDIADDRINTLKINWAKQKEQSDKNLSDKNKWKKIASWEGVGYALLLIGVFGKRVLKYVV